MLNAFSSRSLRARLVASFLVMLVLLVLMAALGLFGLSRSNARTVEIGEVRLKQVQISGSMLAEAQRFQSLVFQHVLADDDAKMEQLENEIAAASRGVDEAIASYTAAVDDAQAEALARQVGDQWADYQRYVLDKVVLVSRGMQSDKAIAAMQDGDSMFRPFRENIDHLVSTDERLAQAAVVAGKRSYVEIQWLTVAGVMVAVLIGSLLLIWLVHSVLRQLGGDPTVVQEIVLRMAQGELNTPIPLEEGDRSSLLSGMQELQVALGAYAAAQVEMLRRHDAGAISHRIDAKTFKGQFAELASSSNALVEQHIQAMQAVTQLMQDYARGNFVRDIERYPGEKQQLSQAVDQVKLRLVAVKDTVLQMARAAADGDFAHRGNAQGFEFAFREIVEGLNGLMESAHQGLSAVGQVLSAMSEGDLTQRVTGDHRGGFGRLRDDTNRMAERLEETVLRIQQSAQLVNQASREIATANQEMSVRTERQAANLEETASSMEELTTTVRRNAENAQQANELSSSSADVARRGSDAVGRVADTMRGIADSARRISEITSVIDGIAFQTNILALNAAVEAARAGEHGRGFAVVAGEVRSLAQRAATSSREIKTLVDESGQRVAEGTQQVDRARQTMDEIFASVKQVTDIMGEIRTASAEQSQGIQQVHENVSQMDEVTQQNAAMVEEAASTAKGMQEQAAAMAEATSFFKLRQSAAPVTAPRSAPTTPPVSTPARTTGRPKLAAVPPRAAPTTVTAASGEHWEAL
jgi:methyl-accepting chemotaxis protein